MQLRDSQKIIIYTAIIILVIAILALSQVIWYTNHAYEDLIFSGVFINKVDVGSLTKEDATIKVHSDISNWLNTSNTTIVNGDTEITISASEIANFDVTSFVEQAYLVGRNESRYKEYINLLKLKFKPYNVDINAIIDLTNIYEKLNKYDGKFYIEPMNAVIEDYSHVNGELKLITKPSEPGYKLDILATALAVQEALMNNSSHIYATMEVVEPTISTNTIIEMTQNPYTYSHAYPYDEDTNNNNIPFDFQEADMHIEPVLIEPNESLSIKEFINYNSFEPAVYSVKQLHIPSVIYACARQVKLGIEEHHVSDFITKETLIYQLGQEALLEANKDLVITNNFDYPIILDLCYEDTNGVAKLICKIYSPGNIGHTYLKSIIEPNKIMYEVKVYRVYGNDTGGVHYRKLLEEHTYPIPPPEIFDETKEDKETDPK